MVGSSLVSFCIGIVRFGCVLVLSRGALSRKGIVGQRDGYAECGAVVVRQGMARQRHSEVRLCFGMVERGDGDVL